MLPNQVVPFVCIYSKFSISYAVVNIFNQEKPTLIISGTGREINCI